MRRLTIAWIVCLVLVAWQSGVPVVHAQGERVQAAARSAEMQEGGKLLVQQLQGLEFNG